jgi:type IX secretion system PorP/SprF family membrane protein
MKMKKIYLIGLLFMCFVLRQHPVFAQTEPMYSQYMYNMLGVNPAFSGIREATSLNFFHRSQWAGLQGAPQTTSVSVDAALKNNKFGWGVQLYDDKLGVEKADGINLMASTKIRISENGLLSGGLSFGLMNYRIDLMSLSDRVAQLNDPVYFANMNKWMPSVGMGVYYNTDRFYAGISIPNVLRSRLTDLDLVKSGIQKANKQHVFITSGYVFDLNEQIKLKPSTMIKIVSGAPIQIDYNANLWLYDLLGFGASYRTDDAVLGMAEVQVNDNLRLGYAYDITISPLKYYNNGSHELMIRYEFGKIGNKVKSTRYF